MFALVSWLFWLIVDDMLVGLCKLPKHLLFEGVSLCWRDWPGPIPITDEDPLTFKGAWEIVT